MSKYTYETKITKINKQYLIEATYKKLGNKKIRTTKRTYRVDGNDDQGNPIKGVLTDVSTKNFRFKSEFEALHLDCKSPSTRYKSTDFDYGTSTYTINGSNTDMKEITHTIRQRDCNVIRYVTLSDDLNEFPKGFHFKKVTGQCYYGCLNLETFDGDSLYYDYDEKTNSFNEFFRSNENTHVMAFEGMTIDFKGAYVNALLNSKFEFLGQRSFQYDNMAYISETNLNELDSTQFTNLRTMIFNTILNEHKRSNPDSKLQVASYNYSTYEMIRLDVKTPASVLHVMREFGLSEELAESHMDELIAYKLKHEVYESNRDEHPLSMLMGMRHRY
jgi:hypothetical protein